MKRNQVLLSVIFVISVILCLGGMETVGANPNPLTFDFTFSGAPENTAVATGFITVNEALFSNPSSGWVDFYLPNPAILDLSVTVTGATSGNGTFTLGNNDFTEVAWDTGGVALDFSKQLVGQPTNASAGYGDPWGTDSGQGGEFGFWAANAQAPNAVFWFWQATSDGSGDGMMLTSMQAVPEPATMLLLGLGLIGVVGVRRKFKQ